jgi:hypothetical protein
LTDFVDFAFMVKFCEKYLSFNELGAYCGETPILENCV